MPSSAAGTVADRAQGEPDEAIDLVPPAVRAWWRTVRPRVRRADVGALAVALGQVPVLLWVLVPGSLYLDDLRGQSYAAGRSWWPFVVESNGTHFSPVARTIDWVTVHVAPLADWPAVVVTVAIRVALVLVVWRLLRELFGPRTALLLPLALVAVTPALLPTTAWYRQAMSSLLVVVLICVAAQQHLRHVRTGSGTNLAGAAATLALGLLTWEKAVLIGPWLVVLTAAALPAATGLRDRLRWVWRARVSFLAYAALTAGHLAIYLTGPFDRGAAGQVSGSSFVGMLTRQMGEALGPGLLGGPWRWQETSPYYSIPDPPTILLVVAAAAAVAFAVVSFRRDRRRATWALVAFGTYFLAAAALVAAGRLATFGAVVGLDYRLWPDVTVVAVVCACLALVPLRGERVPAAAGRTTGGRRPRVLALVAAAVAVGSVVSTVSFTARWHDNPTGSYIGTLRAQLAAQPSRPVRVAPVALPSTVLPFWVDPDYSVEDLLAPVPDLATFHNADGPVLVPGDDGRLLPLRLRTLRTAPEGPDGFCGYAVAPGDTVAVPLVGNTPYYADEMVHLGVLADRATGLDVQVDSGQGPRAVVSRTPLETGQGPHRVLVRVPYDTRVTGLTVRAQDPNAKLCVVLAALVVAEDAS